DGNRGRDTRLDRCRRVRGSLFERLAPRLLLAAPLFLLGELARFLGLALARFLFLALAIGFEQDHLLGFALAARFLQLAQRFRALRIRLRVHLDRTALDVGALLAHLDVDRLGRGAALAGVDLDFADRAPAQRDLAWHAVGIRHRALLAVGTAQEAEQLDLLGAADDLVGIAELHAGFAELRKQRVHWLAEYLGKLFDGDIRHRCFDSWPVLPCPARKHYRIAPRVMK